MSSRKPRFRRVGVQWKLTQRDLEIVRHAARHRFLTTEHIRRLVKGGGQGIVRRLQRLYHAGVLDRPKAQLDYFHRGGSKLMVYALGPHGARMLCERGEKSRINWSAKNRSVTKPFIEHTLRVADFLVALEVACRETDIVRHITAEEIAASLGRKSGVRFRWRISVTHRGEAITLGVVPDAVFALEPKDRPQDRIYYFLEADRATMPVARRHLYQTSACRKFLAYHATWQRQMLRDRLQIHRFRVLTVTTSPLRSAHLKECVANLPSGHGLFVFCNA
jgi:Replication-relaxation